MCASPVAGISSKHSLEDECMCVYERERLSATCVCLYVWECVSMCVCACVITSLKRQLHAEFLNGESLSVMTTKWRAWLSNLLSLLSLSASLSLVLCFALYFPPPQWLYADWLPSPPVSVVFPSFTPALLCLFLPCLYPFSPSLFPFLLSLQPNHHRCTVWNDPCKMRCICQSQTCIKTLNVNEGGETEGRKGQRNEWSKAKEEKSVWALGNLIKRKGLYLVEFQIVECLMSKSH